MWQSKQVNMMGTIIDLMINHPKAEQILEESIKSLKIYEKRFSANDENSELMILNHQAGKEEIPVHPDLFNLIQIGKEHSVVEDSYLNIAIGPLIKAWKIGFSDARIPNPKEIESLLKLIDADQIQLDEEKKTVKLANNMELDLGSLAKGFIADLIITELTSKGATSGLINLGGNIVTFGTPKNPNREKWHIALRNPEGTRDDFKLILKVQDKSVVTSGIYERVLKKDGEKFHHIFDSKTGYPLKTDILSLTIISEKSIDGEIWTTRLYGKEATRIIAEVNELKIIEAIVVTKNQIFYSDGIKEFL